MRATKEATRAAKKTPKAKKAARRDAEGNRQGAPNALGDAFVAVSLSGTYWAGEGWSADLESALRFEAGNDPYRDVRLFCAASKVRCVPLYLFRSPVRKSSPARSRGAKPAGGLPIMATA